MIQFPRSLRPKPYSFISESAPEHYPAMGGFHFTLREIPLWSEQTRSVAPLPPAPTCLWRWIGLLPFSPLSF